MRGADAVIIGAAETPYTRHPADGLDTLGAIGEAAALALEDAGLGPRDIDGLGVASFSLAPDHAIDLAFRLGLPVRWLMDDHSGGASGINLLTHATRAVECGDARAILLVAGDVRTPHQFAERANLFNSAIRDHVAPLRFGGPNALFAMLTQRHAAAHGLEREDYGVIAIRQRAWATGNPGAVYRKPMTREDYLGAPIVADPLSRFDCVPIVAGADALVLAASDVPSDQRPVRMRAIGAAHNCDQQLGDGLATGHAELADQLWSDAGLGPDDVDVVGVYDDYPAMVLVQLSGLGFAPGGDIKRLIHEEIATGRLPVNTSGGLLSAGQAGAAAGLHGLVEAVRQLRGQALGRQREGARIALVSGYGMVAYRYGACANATVLEAAK